MVDGDIPVTGTAVRANEMFEIEATKPNPPGDKLKVRTNRNQRLMIFVDPGDGSRPFTAVLNKDRWKMEIFEF